MMYSVPVSEVCHFPMVQVVFYIRSLPMHYTHVTVHTMWSVVLRNRNGLCVSVCFIRR